MVNFRYHLVSLIAVFTALAIGVVLGAGPLQSRIADAARPEAAGPVIDSAELERAKTTASTEASAVDAVGAQVLPGVLKDVPVALVSLPGTSAQDVAKVRENLTTAGANVVGAVTLTDNWDTEAKARFRQTLATSLESHLSRNVGADVTPDGVIGHAIVEILTTTGAERDVVKEILTDKDSPLISLDEDPQGKATAIVVVGPRTSGVTGAVAQAQSGDQVRSVAAWTGTAAAVALAPKGGVVLGDGSTDASMIAQIRTLGAAVTTVDSVGTSAGALGAVLALPTAGPAARAFGTGVGASEAMPKIK
ncbi:copper transporter [Schaalia sp. 19OD2882]|uniref:copper transporter n=1 Tax=Schaalia sp. 19OD2882 TaxID=2794089 RepID=UPI001C1EA421|nr:copper transporter [Schaalia sp. 19OD2882]QWW18758.1 copper transporter [Schaalia sp. 19OD2882]